jgi:WD40 repeat protein
VARKKLWSGSLLHPPDALALSPDGKRLAVALGDTTQVRLLDLASGACIWQQTPGTGQPEALAFSPDGALLAVGSGDSAICVTDADTGKVRNTLRGHNGGVANLAWSPDGGTLVSGSTTGEIRLWTEPMRSNPKQIDGGWVAAENGGSGSICLSRDGARLAVSHNGSEVRVLATDTLTLVARLPGTKRPVCFTEGGRALLAVTPEGRLKQWRFDGPVPKGEEIAPFVNSAIAKITLSADEHWLAAADTSGCVQVWDWSARQRLFERPARGLPPSDLAFSPDGKTLASVSEDRTIKLWDSRTGRLHAAWPAGGNPLNASFSPRDHTLAVGLSHGGVELRRLKSSPLHRILHTGNLRSASVAFSPDGLRFVCGGPNGLLQVHATDDWREVTTLAADNSREPARDPGNDCVISIQFSANGRVLAAYMANGRLRVWHE